MSLLMKQTKVRLSKELDTFPAALSAQFEESWEKQSHLLDSKQLVMWGNGGLKLARQSARSWEAAGDYFKVSSSVFEKIPFDYWAKWFECGDGLCKKSPPIAGSYFRSSPKFLEKLGCEQLETWSNLGEGLYKGTWKSNTLACKFFEISPLLLKTMSFDQLVRFVSVVESLSRKSTDVSIEALASGGTLFSHMDGEVDTLLSVVSNVVEKMWRQTKSFLESMNKALPKVDETQRARFVQMVDRLVIEITPNLPGTLLEMADCLSCIDKSSHGQILGMAESLVEIDAEVMPEFVRSVPNILNSISIEQVSKWVNEGVRVLEENREGGRVYFRLESARSQRCIESLSSNLDFSQVGDVLQMYCRALAGSEVKVAVSEELVDKSIGWVSSEAPSTEGSTVFIPNHIDKYPTKEENFSWFKVVCTHQVAHLEFGSFDFKFDNPSAKFRDLRPKLGRGKSSQTNTSDDLTEDGVTEGIWISDMQRFFDIFDDRKLALDIFTVLEDGRLDVYVKNEYPGIKKPYGIVQKDSLTARPEMTSLPAREALVEFLVRLSLQQGSHLQVPRSYAEVAGRLSSIAYKVLDPQAEVEDSAEATLRIYAIISKIPNEDVPNDEWTNIDLDDQNLEEEDLLEDDQLLNNLLEGEGSSTQDDYQPSQDVDFRGDYKPELVQLLSVLREQKQSGDRNDTGEQLTKELVEEMLEASAELEGDADGTDEKNSKLIAAKNIFQEVGDTGESKPDLSQGPPKHTEEEGGSLDAKDPQTFTYDEWDFRAEDYKPRWCVVHEKKMEEGNQAYYSQTLHDYGPLASQIRRQFELMAPEMLQKVRKLEHGEEIDVDDLIESFVDIRSGVGPSEKIYWRRNKVQRDVAVVFLLDTSASTAEAIDDSKKIVDEWDPPADPSEYMIWLRNRRSGGVKQSYKRIIDLEKEAVVLLIHALEAIGDVYGIYGFSGYGRENVEFYTVKDIEGSLTDSVKKRIDRITPLHATRMGPAIRHATSKLEVQDARTKLLFLISDGRPQDRGYSREGVEKEYAVHDTKMALIEAKKKNITAFCLTVDKDGHDYLKTMCQDIGYEVLDDIYTLPSRMLHLYKALTM